MVTVVMDFRDTDLATMAVTMAVAMEVTALMVTMVHTEDHMVIHPMEVLKISTHYSSHRTLVVIEKGYQSMDNFRAMLDGFSVFTRLLDANFDAVHGSFASVLRYTFNVEMIH